eukprot:1176483-Rhodomonas_salina.2
MDVRSPGEGREAVHGPAHVRSDEPLGIMIAGDAVSDDKGLPSRAARRRPRPRMLKRETMMTQQGF